MTRPTTSIGNEVMRIITFTFAFSCIVALPHVPADAQWQGIARGIAQQAMSNAQPRPSSYRPQTTSRPVTPSQTINRQGTTASTSPASSGRGTTGATNQPSQSAAPTKYSALIVATRDYSQAGELPSLSGTNRDAELIAAALRRGGYNEDDITLIYDDAQSESLRPTSVNIEKQFFEFLSRADAGVATIFFIGHGITHEGKSYYCAQDTNDDSLADPNPDAAGLISINALANVFAKPANCAAENKLIVVDACRNAASDQYRGLVSSLSTIEDVADDVWILSSCSEGQRSWISNEIVQGERHPVFTYYLAQGLEGAADLLGDHDGRVGLFELFTYAFVKTSETVDAFETKPGTRPIRQTPELFGLAPPFELATVSNLVARRTLTTGDMQAEARRSADQIADDMLVNLRMSEALFRQQISVDRSDEEFARLQNTQRGYLNYLLGNRIRAALEINADCRLAHLARGITYRQAGLFAEALDGFNRGDENFNLFVVSDDQSLNRHFVSDDQGNRLVDANGVPVPKIKRETDVTRVEVFGEPGSGPAATIARESKIKIVDVRDVDGQQWLRFDSLNDEPIGPYWISRDLVHWLPDAVDVYTPSTVMRPMGASVSGVANRFDYAANQMSQLADNLELPARGLEQIAVPLRVPGQQIRAAGRNLGQGIDQFNSGMSRASGLLNSIPGVYVPSFGIPNYPRRMADTAAYYADIPASIASVAAGKARIPAGYVRRGGSYVQMPSNYIHRVQGWSGQAVKYESGHREQVKMEQKRKKLENNGHLGPVKATPIRIAELPWLFDRDSEDEKENKKSTDS
ncbi:caspase family protein [Stieleria maiorica]|nr:caspase family protein [Stieleria maiorica]